jgi:hypothetical protein
MYKSINLWAAADVCCDSFDLGVRVLRVLLTNEYSVQNEDTIKPSHEMVDAPFLDVSISYIYQDTPHAEYEYVVSFGVLRYSVLRVSQNQGVYSESIE